VAAATAKAFGQMVDGEGLKKLLFCEASQVLTHNKL
jgi:hypothetical protein